MIAASMAARMVVAKLAGLSIGIVGFVLLPDHAPEADPLVRWGFLFWHATIGALIGFAGALDRYPLLGYRLRWWVRGPLIAGWMNAVLGLIAHEPISSLSQEAFGLGGPVLVIAGATLEGLVVGAVIGGLATLAGGEGPATVAR